MPDRKKVIETLMQIGIALDMDDYHNDAQAIRDAIGMLKEQEPVRPTWLQGKAYCSSCGRGFPRKRADMEINYCGHCGQAVKW